MPSDEMYVVPTRMLEGHLKVTERMILRRVRILTLFSQLANASADLPSWVSDTSTFFSAVSIRPTHLLSTSSYSHLFHHLSSLYPATDLPAPTSKFLVSPNLPPPPPPASAIPSFRFSPLQFHMTCRSPSAALPLALCAPSHSSPHIPC